MMQVGFACYLSDSSLHSKFNPPAASVVVPINNPAVESREHLNSEPVLTYKAEFTGDLR